MDQQKTNPFSEHLVSYIVILAIGIALGVGGSFVYFNQSGGNSSPVGSVATKTGPSNHSNIPDVIHLIPGTVSAINGNQLTLHTQIPPQIAGKISADHTVLINNSTTIVKLIEKDPKVYQAEMSKFNATRDAGGTTTKTSLRPPLPYATTTASVSDISVGTNISVTTTENILNTKKFTATNIRIFPPRNTNSSAPPSAH